MLKPSYESEDKIPENVKGAYVADSSGKWVLDELDKDHPVLKKNRELQTEKNTLTTQNTALSNAKTLAESKQIPEGFITIEATKAPLITAIEQLEAAGVKLDQVPAMQAELTNLKNEKAENEAVNLRKLVANSVGHNEEAFAPLAVGMEIIQEGEKFFTPVKNGNETENKELTKEYVESLPRFKPFLSSLTAKTTPGNAGDPPVHGGNEPSADAKARAASEFKSMF